MTGQLLAVMPVGIASEHIRKVLERRIEQSEEAAKRALLTRVRRGGHQEQVALGVGRKRTNEFMELVSCTAGAFARIGARVGLVHDHQVRTGAYEIVSATIAFDEIDGDDRVRMVVEHRFAMR